jgi:hypothetical protein
LNVEEASQITLYQVNKGVVSNIDVKRLFLQLMDASDVDAADPNLRVSDSTRLAHASLLPITEKLYSFIRRGSSN